MTLLASLFLTLKIIGLLILISLAVLVLIAILTIIAVVIGAIRDTKDEYE